jgi:GNAT superfamily N-acetyltransferase
MNEPTFREATAADLNAIEALFKQLDEHHVRRLPEVFAPVDGPARASEFIGQIIDSNRETIIVAELDGAVVAFAHVGVADMPDTPVFRPRMYALLKNVIVADEHQRRGIGTGLLDAATLWARARGLNELQTIVWTANREATRFYEAAGFEQMTSRLRLNIG